MCVIYSKTLSREATLCAKILKLAHIYWHAVLSSVKVNHA